MALYWVVVFSAVLQGAVWKGGLIYRQRDMIGCSLRGRGLGAHL